MSFQPGRFLPSGPNGTTKWLYQPRRGELDVRRRGKCLADTAFPAIQHQAKQDLTHRSLMRRPRCRRHEELSIEHFVPVAIVGERPDHIGRPGAGSLWHAHKMLGLGAGGQGSTPREYG